jgi:iron complex outermembrane receptor protein
LWDAQNYLLADIERIEVIRGPGGALWGSNAVNGVINITTKNARDTQGLYVEAGAGTEERAFAGARFGGATAGGVHYRAFGQYFERDASFSTDPVRSDDWRAGHFGFRADWEPGAQDTMTVQGDVYRGNVGHLAPSISIVGRPEPAGDLEAGISGGNVLGRWQRRLDADSDLQVRAYYDITRRDDPSFKDTLDTFDLDFQHRFAPAPRHELIWGLGYRHTSNRNQGKVVFAVAPPSSTDRLASGFVQDQISFTDSLRVTVGTKLEHNDFSGFEVQPGIRAAWDFRPGHTAWSAVSRAVRVPTRLERDIAIDVSDPAADPVTRLLGSDNFEAEELSAHELGYRWQALESLSVDLAAFYNRYRGLASLEIGETFTDPADGRTVTPIVNRNLTRGKAHGLEALVTYYPRPFWRLSAHYSYLDLSLDARGLDLNGGRFYAGATPRHQFGVHSFLDLPAGFQLDMQLRSLSSSRLASQVASRIAGYTELDIRLAWHGPRGCTLSLVGQNLLHRRHAEFGPPDTRGQIERGVYGKIEWGF